MANRIGVDVGGTFTDLVLVDDASGAVTVGKQLSTPEAPEQAVLAVVDEVVGRERLAGCRLFLHGTTVALNALLERKGARVGLLATDGFRDVLEKRRSNYGEEWSPTWHPGPPLVPRRHRLPVRERIAADGSVVAALEAEDVRAAVAELIGEGIECIAIAFLNAYANPAHELAAEAVVRETGFAGPVVLSHRISGEYREFERTATTVVDAYIRPRVSGYLDRLEAGLRERGCTGELLLTRSGGGALTFAEARQRPFELIMSGPVGGAMGASRLADALGARSVVAADVGGTSFDTCLITDGAPGMLFEGEILGLPIQAPWVDVRSIGAGGGSIAWVDQGGLLLVGPHSAGSRPGPAAYGRGGEQPTVTDAAVVLGLLADATMAGDLALDAVRARAAFEPLAVRLGLPVEQLARGALVIAASMMAGTIKTITLERGIDPREGTLMLFGGAGGIFASLLAEELGVEQVAVPAHPGNFSALGLLGADLLRGRARTRLLPLDEGGLADAAETLAALFAELDPQAAGDGGVEPVREAALDLRFAGQEHTLTIPVSLGGAGIVDGPAALAGAFASLYDATFGHVLDAPVQVVTMRASLREPIEPPALGAAAGERPARGEATVRAYSFARDAWLPFAVVHRDALAPGDLLPGPAIVVEPTSTTYVDAGFAARADATGALLIRKDAR
ncbi:MAG: hydantoinase/oxoprolinase family protein [Thermoleophilia bacterium]